LRGRKILQELEGLLPKMENMVTPSLFDPMREKSHFRISGPDNVCTVVLPRLCRQYGDGYQVQFEFLPWQANISELVERGQLDLILRVLSAKMRGAVRDGVVQKQYPCATQ
jgi:DNA-binding transcriptional LysR family regulator